MDGLNFDDLTDDQLIMLIRAACTEAVRRGTAVAAAAQDAYLSEVERARIATDAAERAAEQIRAEEVAQTAAAAAEQVRAAADRGKIESAAERERKLWAQRKGIAQALEAVGYDVAGDSLVVWLSASKEKRVFLQEKKFGGFTYATLFVTGNMKHAPGSVELSSGCKKDPDLSVELPKILRAVAAQWNAIKIDLAAALAWEGDALPLPGYTGPSPVAA
jgi:hypothetical protein